MNWRRASPSSSLQRITSEYPALAACPPPGRHWQGTPWWVPFGCASRARARATRWQSAAIRMQLWVPDASALKNGVRARCLRLGRVGPNAGPLLADVGNTLAELGQPWADVGRRSPGFDGGRVRIPQTLLQWVLEEFWTRFGASVTWPVRREVICVYLSVGNPSPTPTPSAGVCGVSG